MFCQDKTPEPGNGGQAADEDGLAGASRQDARRLFLGEAVEDVNAIRNTNADDKRQCHNIRRIERKIFGSHNARKPNHAHAYGNK